MNSRTTYFFVVVGMLAALSLGGFGSWSAETDTSLVSLEEIENGDVQKYFQEQMQAMRQRRQQDKPQDRSKLTPAPDQEVFNNAFDRWFGDDFFKFRKDPMGDMRKFRDKVRKPFDSWYGKKFGGTVGEVSRREDEQAVYYEIGGKGTRPKDLSVKVDRGLVTIRGMQESRSEGKGSVMYFSSSYTRSFPVPQGVDENKVEMKQEGEKIVLRFPKVKA